ncbi:DnaJ sub B member 13 [Lobulomyces angularis]|nr:DnaJ sub B member 13 [Lobulomyces angularis]
MNTVPERDFYQVLNLDRSASPDDIRRHYRKLALKHHPDKSDSAASSETFLKITEAFHVLNDANRRAIYDQYGIEGLKNGVPSRPGFDGFRGQYQFHGDVNAVFQEFFGGNNPFSDFFNDHVEHPISLFGSKFGGMHGMSSVSNAEGPTKDPPFLIDLPLTLEELYSGTVKKVKIQRKVLEENGMSTTNEEICLTIDVKKGWKDGTQIVFPKEGDQGPNKIPNDIIFVVKEKPHHTFQRQGDNLTYTTTVSLVKALTNSVITITTLDERILRIPINDVISPDYVKEVSEEGMPNSKDNNIKGKLYIKFNVKFPTYLSEEKKKAIQQAFDL